jgi:hypothetical protein
VSKEEYIKITETFTLKAAEAFRSMKEGSEEPFNFVFYSGGGANWKDKGVLFARTKVRPFFKFDKRDNMNGSIHRVVSSVLSRSWNYHYSQSSYVPVSYHHHQITELQMMVGVRRQQIWFTDHFSKSQGCQE